MNKFFCNTLLAFCVVLTTTSCKAQKYAVQSVDFTSFSIDSTYDKGTREDLTAFMAPYKAKVDSVMSPVVGQVACEMSAERPESNLSNLLADILVWAGRDFDEQPVMGLYNIGGVRASLSPGDVTVGDVIDMAPFENKLCFMTLSGTQLTTLFEQIAVRGGEGVSHAIRAVISSDGKLVSLTVNGAPVDPNGEYRLATIDYLAEGNDGMPVLRDGTNRKMLTDKSNNLRFVIMNYFREKAKAGEAVTSEVEGRIVVR